MMVALKRNLLAGLPAMTIATLVLFLALCGGISLFTNQPIAKFFVIAGIVTLFTMLITIIWSGFRIPLIVDIFALYYVVMFLSMSQNISPAGVVRLFLFLLFLAVIYLTSKLERADVWSGFYLAGLLWPAAWLLAHFLGWPDNRNVMAAWSVIFVAIALHLRTRSWWYLVMHLVILAALGSRGAIIGAAAAILVSIPRPIWSRFDTKTATIYGLAGLVSLAGLAAWRPNSTMIRLHYWRSACDAFLSSPWVGVGPGGLRAGQWIPEGEYYQLHAHNIIVTTGAELGIMGLIALAAIVWLWRRSRFDVDRWQYAAIAGILAHSMVDEPLWWPGPLLGLAVILGTIKTKAV